MNDWQSARGDDWGSGYSVEGTSLRTRFGALMRPMTVQEMIDDAIALYREGFGTMLRISFLTYLPFLSIGLLFLIPVLYLDATSTAPMTEDLTISYWISYCSSLLMLPGYALAPGFQSAFVSLTAHRMIQGEKPTAREVWRQFKPQFWNLVANQLLVMLALFIIYVLISVLFLLGFVAWTAAIGLSFGAAGGGGTASVILLFLGMFVLSILIMVLAAASIMWMTIMPQIIVLEGLDAISAFGRAIRLMTGQFKRAIGCCLAFWGVQAVLSIALYLFLILIFSIIIALAATYGDIDQLMIRWLGTSNQLFNLLGYLAYIVLMPAMCLCTLMYYYDLRFRTEGLDIQMLKDMSKKTA
jgi:hypothetical protein